MTPTIVIALEPNTAERVALIGGELARGLKARVVLAHVLNDPPALRTTPDRERTRHRNERRGRQVLEWPRAVLERELDVEKRVEPGGGVVDTLAEIATDENAALIVVGSRGRGPLATALFGSVSQTLAREAPCPVTIVPQAASGTQGAVGERATMVAGVDGSPPSSAAARFAGALADRLDHRLVVVELSDRVNSRANALAAISASEGAGMIIVGAEQREHRRRRPGRSLAASLPRLARCPVTVVPNGATTNVGHMPGTADYPDPRSATGA